MKKVLLTIAISTLCALSHAVPQNGTTLDLCVSIIDRSKITHDKGKVPMRMPEISLDGTTLFFPTHHPEYIINIVQDGEVVFTSAVPADAAQYELPGYISGECVIQFLTGNYCFWAEIIL